MAFNNQNLKKEIKLKDTDKEPVAKESTWSKISSKASLAMDTIPEWLFNSKTVERIFSAITGTIIAAMVIYWAAISLIELVTAL